MPKTIVWMRRDLRLADQSAVEVARAGGEPLAVLVTTPSGPHAPGGAALRWRDAGLATLCSRLEARGARVVVAGGDPVAAVAQAASDREARTVVTTADNTPSGRREQEDVARALAAWDARLEILSGQCAVDPDALRTESGAPYRVFTPFWRAWRQALGPAADAHGGPEDRDAAPGEPLAADTLARFRDGALAGYPHDRDIPGIVGTSGLSAALAWGEISARRVIAETLDGRSEAATAFVRQLAWRDFAYHVLAAHPNLLDEPLRPEFSAFPWTDDEADFSEWIEGRTGYPLVDAGMRELAETGWMHGRVRMVCASFLTKHLLVEWQRGAAHFEAALRDYDPAINAFNWQWVAGCGADAAPFFRIFNPALQGRRFDADGVYVRRWVPELARLDRRWIHEPAAAPPSALTDAGVRLGRDYPLPMIDHRQARERALAAYRSIRTSRDV